MPRFENIILTAVARKNYQPVKPKILAKKLGVAASEYSDFRRTLKKLQKQGRIEFGKNHTIRQIQPHGTATGVFRKANAGYGFVRPTGSTGQGNNEIFIPEHRTLDASSGDEVMVRILKKPNRSDLGPSGEILQVLERATRQFVGTYLERDGQGLVRVDGTIFAHSVLVGDPGAKGAKPQDKVVFEMIRFPTAEDRGEGVITEVLGERGKPGVDLLSVMREFNLPEKFPEEVLEEARQAAAAFNEKELYGREDFTKTLTITIDPVDARDFDDAVSLLQDQKSRHWFLTVHIADVAHFAPPGSLLDREARKRATSVYLPQRVIPMFPEIISNNLASLQQGRVRYVKTVQIEFTPEGQVVHTRFANAAIKVFQRFAYQQVMDFLDRYDAAQASNSNGTVSASGNGDGTTQTATVPAVQIHPAVASMLLKMREFAMILRQRRLRRGALELDMPEAELEYDNDGKVVGAHFAKHDVSHQIIEEFMLAANEAVAQHFDDMNVAVLRRVHPPPIHSKLMAFGQFARILGYKITHETDRFALQRVLKQSSNEPDKYAVHYALLRSLKQAVYSPKVEAHYALASDNYCHFTSPIRRYPDLVVHRLLEQWLKTGKAGSDVTELAAIGEHCSKMERRAELAERELIKTKLLTYMSERIDEEYEVIITGVADYGFYAQPESLPVEGLVRVTTMNDDYYYFDEAGHSLIGKKHGRSFRLGDTVKVQVSRVDLQKRQMDFRIVENGPPSAKKKSRKRKK